MKSFVRAELDAIVQGILPILPDARIMLFGSYATGNESEGSDLDICVIAKAFPMRRMDTIHALRDAVAHKTTLPLDILLYQTDEFEKNALLAPTFEYAISKEGVTLHA